MPLPESSPPANSPPAVSVLVTTYNRSTLLRRALASILDQDFADFEIVVVDDQSSDDTPQIMAEYRDPRIRYVRNAQNMARQGGDRSIFQRFVDQQARGEFFVWLCDDDYWLPKNLLSRQVRIMREHASVAMVFGAMAQLYPTSVALWPPNEPYLSYEFVGEGRNITFAHNVFPDGFLPSETFLDLFAADPKNRNNVTGATMFRAAAFRRAGALAHGTNVRWQSGYMMIAGTATAGDVWYIDEPCVVATVEISSASYRGTQLDHLRDCLRSIDAAFHTALEDPDTARRARMAGFRAKMMHSILMTYVENKLAHRFGLFAKNPLGGIEKALVPPITTVQFARAIRDYRIPMSMPNIAILVIAGIPDPLFQMLRTIYKLVPRRKGVRGAWLSDFIRAPGR
jgi:glycosyltransferase involved in cell wall biosynthesis